MIVFRSNARNVVLRYDYVLDWQNFDRIHSNKSCQTNVIAVCYISYTFKYGNEWLALFVDMHGCLDCNLGFVSAPEEVREVSRGDEVWIRCGQLSPVDGVSSLWKSGVRIWFLKKNWKKTSECLHVWKNIHIFAAQLSKRGISSSG